LDEEFWISFGSPCPEPGVELVQVKKQMFQRSELSKAEDIPGLWAILGVTPLPKAKMQRFKCCAVAAEISHRKKPLLILGARQISAHPRMSCR
jgi:hypothetical protein